MALTDNILAYWKFDNDGDGGVSLIDSTPNAYNLTAPNGTSGVSLGTGIINGDANFSGDEQTYFVTSGNIIPATSELSFSAWVKNPGVPFQSCSSTNYNDLGASGPNLNFNWYGNNIYWQVGVDGGSFDNLTSDSNINDGSWHHVVGTWNQGGNQIIYVDGIEVANAPASGGTLNTIAYAQYINGAPLLQQYGIAGQLDEYGIWNRELSSSEVTLLYNGGAGRTYPFVILFFNAAVNNDWGTLGNWWQDPSFTIPATALPDNTTAVYIYGDVVENTDGDGTCYCKSAEFYSASFYSPLVLDSAVGVVNISGTGGVFDGTASASISLHDTCSLGENAVIIGNATFRDTSTNSFGQINGNAFFYESSYNYGNIDGNATVYYSGGDGTYPIGGTVTGSVTYLGWPAVTPQYFNDVVSGGADDGDFSNKLNWWADEACTIRPINAEGTQELPDPSTNVIISPNRAIYANTGTTNPTINSLTANNGELVYITITISNGATFGGSEWGMYQANVFGDVTFNSGSYNQQSTIHGTAKYASVNGLVGAWNTNSLANLNTNPESYGSTGFEVSISESSSMISRLLNLPWFINI